MDRDAGARQGESRQAPMGEHQAAGSWANADHAGKRGSSSEIRDNGAARVGYPQELPTHHQKDKGSKPPSTGWAHSSKVGTYTETTPSYTQQKDTEAHTSEYF